MLKLKKIKLNSNILSAEYYPENGVDYGTISIDVETMKIIKTSTSKYDEPLPIYLDHAIEALKELSKMADIPQDKLIMWY